MIEKILLFCLIVYSEAQTQSQAQQSAPNGPWIFDLPPLNLQPLQLRLNPSPSQTDAPALLLIKQNESIPVTTLLPEQNGVPQWSAPTQWPQTAQWTQSANPQWMQQTLVPVQQLQPTVGGLSPQLSLTAPQTQLPTQSAQITAQAFQPLKPVEPTKPLVPLAFTPLSSLQTVSAQQPTAPKLQNWGTQQQSVAPKPSASWLSNFKAMTQNNPQLSQTFTNLVQKPTQLTQPIALQQNTQILSQNNGKDSFKYQLTDISSVLQSLQNSLQQSYAQNQIPTQSLVGQQIAPQSTDKNIRYFPTVTLPAINLPSNELPVKVVDLTQINQPIVNTLPSGTTLALENNPDRSTWSSAQAATLNQQTISAPKAWSAFPSLQRNVWSQHSPLQNSLASPQPQPNGAAFINQLPSVPESISAAVQSWPTPPQQPLPSPPIEPVSIPSPLQGLSVNGWANSAVPLRPVAAPAQLWSNQIKPLPTPAAAQPALLTQAVGSLKPWQTNTQLNGLNHLSAATPIAPLPSVGQPQLISNGGGWQTLQPLAPLSASSPLTPWPSAPGPVKPFSRSPLNLQPLPSAPIQPLSATPIKPFQSIAPLQSLPAVSHLQPWSRASLQPLQPLPTAAPLQPLPAIKPLPSNLANLSPLQPLQPLQPIQPLLATQLQSPVPLSPLTPPSNQVFSTIDSNRGVQWNALKPLSLQPLPSQNLPLNKWSNGWTPTQALTPKALTLAQTQPNVPNVKRVSLGSIRQTHLNLPNSSAKQWNGNGVTALGQVATATAQFGTRLPPLQNPQINSYFNQKAN